MARVFDTIGSATNTAGATVTLTNVNVPAGSLIYVAVYEKTSNPSPGTFSDTAGNTYTFSDQGGVPGGVTLGVTKSSYVFNSLALSNGTITYTKTTSGATTGLIAFWASGIRKSPTPFDSVLDGAAIGTSIHPNNLIPQIGNFSFPGELLVTSVFWAAGVGDVFVNDTTAPWTEPPDQIIDGANGLGMAGGYIFVPTTAPVSYSATLNNSRPWRVAFSSFIVDIVPSIDDADQDVGMV